MSDICIYTVGDRAHGMGHVVRCLTLAGALKASGFGVVFATQHETPGYERLRKSPYLVTDYAPDDVSWTNRARWCPACIIDVENGPTRAMLGAARKFAKVIVIGGSGYLMTDREAIREMADLFVAQTILPNDADVTGADQIIINPEYARCMPDLSGHILISMGGSDPRGMTYRALEVLDGIGRKLIVINGQASEAMEISEKNDSVMFVHAPDSLASYMHGAALFIGALGMSAFEAAAAGVPAILTAWSDDHRTTAEELQRQGVAVSIGVWNEFDGVALASTVKDILRDAGGRSAMSRAGKALIDGQGAARVAERIARLLTDESVMVMEPRAEHIIHAGATVQARRKGKHGQT